MEYVREARRILIDTNIALRDLIARALADQRYAEVVHIAQVADAVARLLPADEEERPADSGAALLGEDRPKIDAPTSSVTQPPLSPKAVRARRSTADEYPRFERDGDKLVKIGWSKRDDRVYEHRAPREVVDMVAAALSSKIKPKSMFTMDQVLPITDQAGADIPSYQAYLVLAWLRSIGAVQRRGKEGYMLASGSVESSKLQRLWNAIPSRH